MLLAIFVVFGIILFGLNIVSAVDSTETGDLLLNDTNVTVNHVYGYAGKTVNLTANVTSNDTPVNEGSVKFL